MREEYESKPPPEEPPEPEPAARPDDDAVDLHALGATLVESLHPDGPLGGIIAGLHGAAHDVIDRMAQREWQAVLEADPDRQDARMYLRLVGL